MKFGQQFRNFRRELGYFSCPKAGTLDRLFYFPSEERHAVDFSDRKNPTASVGREPAILGMLTPRPPNPLCNKNKQTSLETCHVTTSACFTIFVILSLIKLWVAHAMFLGGLNSEM
jgi:hypothetical protein